MLLISLQGAFWINILSLFHRFFKFGSIRCWLWWKCIISPGRVENKTYFKPPPSFPCCVGNHSPDTQNVWYIPTCSETWPHEQGVLSQWGLEFITPPFRRFTSTSRPGKNSPQDQILGSLYLKASWIMNWKKMWNFRGLLLQIPVKLQGS